MQRPKLDGGGTTTLASLRGQVVVLNFWASWCPPCIEEAPILAKADKKLAQDGGGTVLGATYNDASDHSRTFLREHGLNYPNIRDVGTDLARKFGVNGLPETFVLDRNGNVVALSRGAVTTEFLDAAIAKARGA
jgi:cytochrome c biogenesis protein CcmG/thiol:disulfide interchange protein DsbE